MRTPNSAESKCACVHVCATFKCASRCRSLRKSEKRRGTRITSAHSPLHNCADDHAGAEVACCLLAQQSDLHCLARVRHGEVANVHARIHVMFCDTSKKEAGRSAAGVEAQVVCRPKWQDFGKPHPDVIVESASLAAVSAPRIVQDISALKVCCRVPAAARVLLLYTL